MIFFLLQKRAIIQGMFPQGMFIAGKLKISSKEKNIWRGSNNMRKYVNFLV